MRSYWKMVNLKEEFMATVKKELLEEVAQAHRAAPAKEGAAPKPKL